MKGFLFIVNEIRRHPRYSPDATAFITGTLSNVSDIIHAASAADADSNSVYYVIVDV
jgi:hypothetical protein